MSGASTGPEATAHFGLEGPNHEGGVSAECVGGRVLVRTYGDRSLGGGDGDFSPEEFAQRWGATARGAPVVAWLRQQGWLGARSG